jgi:hypothetical protein
MGNTNVDNPVYFFRHLISPHIDNTIPSSIDIDLLGFFHCKYVSIHVCNRITLVEEVVEALREAHVAKELALMNQ